jgi:pyrroline-5-carboxylate reductase
MEAQVDAAAARGLDHAQAARMYVDTLAGTAALLEARGSDPVTLRREVTSPGGMTERGLAVLEEAGLRDAYVRALDAVAGRVT